MKHGKKYTDSAKAVDRSKLYDAPEALELAASNAKMQRLNLMKLSKRISVWALTRVMPTSR